MKKLLFLIICLSSFFSSTLLASAEEGIIDQVLNLQFETEKIQYKLAELPAKSFTDKNVQNKYNEFRVINELLTDEFYQKYRNGKIDFYTTKGIISQHKSFIYNTSKLFDSINLKLRNPHYRDVDEIIMQSLSQMRISFNRIKFLYKRSEYNYQKEYERNYYRHY